EARAPGFTTDLTKRSDVRGGARSRVDSVNLGIRIVWRLFGPRWKIHGTASLVGCVRRVNHPTPRVALPRVRESFIILLSRRRSPGARRHTAGHAAQRGGESRART